MSRRPLRLALTGLLVLGGLIQLAPLRVENPPITQEPAWDSPETRALAQRACFDCHSNQVELPAYGYVAPVSWWLLDHVTEAREHLNFSEMDRPQRDADEAGEEVLEGEMPPRSYLLMHPEARLSDAERRQLAQGLAATLGGALEGEEGEHEEDEHEEGES